MTSTPRRIGRYRLDEVIGVGTFATVHRAFDERLDDTVVVKVLAENHSLNPDIRGRFIAEGRSLRRVDSPHVVRAYDIGETDHQQPYLVLEHADRGTLASRLSELRSNGWSPTATDVSTVSRSLAAAIEAVHRAHLVHRDLSPGNVLLRSLDATTDPRDVAVGRPPSAVVRPDEALVVADLGMCKDLAINSGLTVAGGTDGFRPPEQRGGPGTIDERADLWALSALMVWLCTGRRADHIDPHVAFAELDLPTGLGDALGVSLADDPASRHPDVAAWLAAIETALAPPAPPSAPTLSAASPGSRIRRRGVVLVAMVALIVGGAIGVGVGRWLGSEADDTTVEELPDGRVRVSDESGTARLALVGPAEVAVGEQPTFEVDTSGISSWVWTMPDGRNIVDEPDVDVRANSPGRAEITLRARSDDGDELEATHELRVVDE